MKQYGLLGKGTGKLGSSVFAISGGEQIVREYNPKVSNPNTAAQVEQRAKFKLLSQLGADFATILAFSKMGLKSARNLFVSKNLGKAEFNASDGATIDMTKLELTPGTRQLPAMEVTFDTENEQALVGLGDVTNADADIIVMAVVTRQNDRAYIFEKRIVKFDEWPAGGQVHMDYVSNNDYVYVYGIKIASGARTRYENYSWTGTDDEAKLEFIQSLVTSGSEYSASKCYRNS